MRSKRHIITPILILMLAGLTACSDSRDPVSPGSDAHKSVVDAVGDPTDLDNFVVTFDGRTFDGQQTTFQWTVAGTGEGPDLRYFAVELPECAPEPSAYSPTEGAQYYYFDGPDAYTLKWSLGLGSGDTVGRQYSITFPGNVSQGTVRGLFNNSVLQVLDIPGPCAGNSEIFTISGSVFIDADADGVRDAAEGGLGNVAVDVSGDGGSESVLTDADGYWSVERFAGTWTVTVDTLGHPEAFNPALDQSFDATTAVSREVTVGPDAMDLDFGFNPSVEAILEDVEQGVIQSSGESVKWWKRQFQPAVGLSNNPHAFPETPNGKRTPPRPDRYDPETLLGFLTAIEGLYLPLPYAFTPGDELDSAFRMLLHHPADDYEDLYRELLVTELNLVSGRGLVGVDPALQDALVSWGESLLVLSVEDAAKADLNLLGAARVFRSINTGGGGGIDD